MSAVSTPLALSSLVVNALLLEGSTSFSPFFANTGLAETTKLSFTLSVLPDVVLFFCFDALTTRTLLFFAHEF